MIHRLLQFLRPSPPLSLEPESLVIPPDVVNGIPGIHPERFITLDAGVNFRDLGGYKTRDGRYVRWGKLYRSGSFARLTESDLAAINRLHVRLICDLRSSQEVKQSPERLPGIAYEHLPIEAQDDTLARLRALFFDPSQLVNLLVKAYTEQMIVKNSGVYRTVFERLADPNNLPALIRCTAGKDRTGITIALLLLTLGVSEETVIADYSLSNLHFRDFQAYARQAIQPLGIFGVSVDDLHVLLLADPDTLRRTLTFVRNHYGSVESYLRDHAHITASTLDALRDNLLE